jgi:hypothetical protein
MTPKHIYTVLSWQRTLANTGWQLVERLEVISAVRPRHYETSVVVADYINRKFVCRNHKAFANYDAFEAYLWEKFPEQMTELTNRFNVERKLDAEPGTTPVIVDNFGVSRLKTVFDA